MNPTTRSSLALACLGLCLLQVALAASSSSASSSSSSSSSSSNTRPQRRPSTGLSLGYFLPRSWTESLLSIGLGVIISSVLAGSSRRRSGVHESPANSLAEQFVQPVQTHPQDLYYFTKRSFGSPMAQVDGPSLAKGLRGLGERVLRAIDNADRRYSQALNVGANLHAINK